MADPTETDESIEVIEFSTPAAKMAATRAEIPLALVGETYQVTRPKDAVLFTAQGAVADTASDADRWLATLQLVEAMFSPQDRHRFYQRCIDRDDPLTQGAVMEAIGALLTRWAPKSKVPASEPVTIEAHPDAVSELGLKPVRIVNGDLNLDLTCHPPKDLMLGIVSAALAAGTDLSQQAWSINLFLDAVLEPGQDRLLAHRLRSPQDPLDLEHLAEITKSLIERWYSGAPKPNRAARRASAAAKRKTPAKKKA